MGRTFKVAMLWWTAQLMLALPLAFAFWSWASGQTAYSPATDSLISGINVATIVDLMRGDHVGILAVMRSGAVATALVAGLLTPFLIGGTLAALRAPQPRVLPAVLAGASHAPGALLLIWIVTRGVGALLALTISGIVTAAVDRIGGEFWEPGPFVGFLGGAFLAVVVWWLLVAVGDVAMILRTEAAPARAFRALFRALVIVLRRVQAFAGIWLLRGIAPASLIQLGYLRVSDALLTTPAALVGLQQSVMMIRAWCRVGILAAERDLVIALQPAIHSPRRDEDQIAPGQDREREIEQRQDGEGPVQLEQVQEHRAADSEELGDGQRGTDPSVTEGHRDDRVALGETEGGDPQVGEDPVKRL